jgi:Glutaminase
MILEKIQSLGLREANNYFENYFEELRYYLNPLFQYKQGNCHNVSHYASLILRSYGVSHKKIWIYAPSRYNESSKLTIQLPDPNNISPKGFLTWGFHVALLIQHQGEEFVFDYFVDEEKPMTVGNWIASMNISNFYIDIEKPDYYLFYGKPSKKKKNGLFYGKYFEYEGLSKDENWLAKGLAINETAIHFYKNEFYHFQYKTPLSDDYRLFAGSINNFECVLRDKFINNKMTLCFQHTHKDIISKYHLIYAQNLEKWTEKVRGIL